MVRGVRFTLTSSPAANRLSLSAIAPPFPAGENRAQNLVLVQAPLAALKSHLDQGADDGVSNTENLAEKAVARQVRVVDLHL